VEGLALGASSHLVVVSTNLWNTFSGEEVGWRRVTSDEGSESTKSYLWNLTGLAQAGRRNPSLLHHNYQHSLHVNLFISSTFKLFVALVYFIT
jgi:hypothetical protein